MDSIERITPFTLHRPASLEEAIALGARHAGARFVAGGTDLVTGLRRGVGDAADLIDLTTLPELRAFDVADDGSATIGAAITLARITGSAALGCALPALAAAARTVAGPAHRSVATVGGNLCLGTRCVFYNQSEWWRSANGFCLKAGGDTCHVAPQGTRCHAAFSGDLAPVLLVLGAAITISGPHAMRHIVLSGLYREDGAGEVLVAIQVPAQPARARSGYRKARARGAIDFPLAGVAARVETGADGRLHGLAVALTGTNPRPFLLEGVDALIGQVPDEAMLAQLARLVQRQVTPMRTTVTSADYRRQVAGVLAQRLVRELATAQ